MRPTCFVGRVSDADFSRDALQGGEAERDGPVGRCVPGGYQHAAVYPLQARQDEFTRATRRHRVEGVVVCRIIRNGLSVADGFQQRKFEDGERRGTYVERELPADVFSRGNEAEFASPALPQLRQRSVPRTSTRFGSESVNGACDPQFSIVRSSQLSVGKESSETCVNPAIRRVSRF